QAHKTLLPSTPVNLRYARTCYDHLAGELAVNIYEFMLREKWLAADGLALTSAGKTQLERLGAVFNARPRRKPCCPCLD
ncbi:transcriptional regulator, partial [Acinetobacter baumannii]|nr:transcriptional regulator [Acinetobacter baumannii]